MSYESRDAASQAGQQIRLGQTGFDLLPQPGWQVFKLPLWTKLNEEQKHVYIQKAKEYKEARQLEWR